MNKIILIVSLVIMTSCANREYNKHLSEAKIKMTTECMIDDPSKDRHVCSKEADESIQKFKDMIGDR